MVTMREVTEINAEVEKAPEYSQEDKVRRNASQFLDAWVGNKKSDITKNSYSGNVDFRAKKTLFENVQLHGYKIIACEGINGNKVGIQVDVTMAIRGKIRKKRILIYSVKIKNEWKVDMKSLVPS